MKSHPRLLRRRPNQAFHNLFSQLFLALHLPTVRGLVGLAETHDDRRTDYDRGFDRQREGGILLTTSPLRARRLLWPDYSAVLALPHAMFTAPSRGSCRVQVPNRVTYLDHLRLLVLSKSGVHS